MSGAVRLVTSFGEFTADEQRRQHVGQHDRTDRGEQHDAERRAALRNNAMAMHAAVASTGCISGASSMAPITTAAESADMPITATITDRVIISPNRNHPVVLAFDREFGHHPLAFVGLEVTMPPASPTLPVGAETRVVVDPRSRRPASRRRSYGTGGHAIEATLRRPVILGSRSTRRGARLTHGRLRPDHPRRLRHRRHRHQRSQRRRRRPRRHDRRGRASSASADREIDADGALVIPGIVDIHSHYDGQATWDQRLQPSSWHGVTTVVTGNCGVGFAPVHDADHDKLIELMEGVEDIPGAALHEGLPWNWNSFGEFLDAVDSIPHDIDVAMQVPHGALRLNVMGERGANHEDATPDDIASMAELAREGIEAGALGFTTSRTRNHKTSTGAYTPTLTAAPDELIGIAQGVGAAGTGVLQVVSDFLDPDAEFAMLREMVTTSGRPMSISIARNPMVPDAFRGLLDQITAANADGLTMTGQVAPRAVGLILGLECTLNPFLTNPVYRDDRRPPARRASRPRSATRRSGNGCSPRPPSARGTSSAET